MDKKQFGLYIKESRLKKGYTQQELADLLFIDVSAVSKWERGVSYPDITLVPDICRVLEISEHELIASSHDGEYRKMKKDAFKYNNMKKVTFWNLNISYAIAILTCFIVNVAVSHTLSWFYIVLSSIICAYTFCPTLTWLFDKSKKLVFVTSTFLSISLLLFTCSVYTKNYWFMIAVLGVLLGYFIIFYPILFKSQKRYLDESKYYKLSKWFLLSYTLIMFIITCLLLVSIYIYQAFPLWIALLITGGCFMVPILLGILNLFDITKDLTKPIILSIAGVLVIALLICFVRTIHLKTTETTSTYVIEQEYSDIKITGDTFDINIYLSDSNENKVVYTENKKVTVKSEVVEGVLMITQIDERKFYDKLFDWNYIKVSLYLNKATLNSLNIKSNTSDININNKFSFSNVKINNSTGDISIKNIVVSDTLDIKNSTGNIKIRDVNCNRLNIKTSTGDTYLTNSIAISEFSLVSTTGDVNLDGFDSNSIDIIVSTGDIRGTLLTSKIFIVKSKTGNVNIPESLTGGKCKIETSTGNINISYK